ncbi:MAG: peptidylprolyl isomerase [Dehalococcoidales bacterium]|nr:peptidylprolyl isomerase [Dehalococcoidales bacterium]
MEDNVLKALCYILLAICSLGILVFSGCSGNNITAKNGDIIKVHYTGKLDDGTVFDTSAEREPLEFTLGEGRVISGFEEAVRDMQVGQSKTITIPADQAYGQHRDDLVMIAERTQLPEDLIPELGQQLQMQQPDGTTTIVVIIDISETTITVDANHPLAGKDLTFEIEVVEIN